MTADAAYFGAGCPGPIVAVVTDSCGTCGATAMNLHAHSFSAIANLQDGHVAVRYRQAGRSLNLVSSTWRDMRASYGAVWELSGIPLPPLDMRLTAADGQQVIIREAITQAGKAATYPTQAQFPVTPNANAADLSSHTPSTATLLPSAQPAAPTPTPSHKPAAASPTPSPKPATPSPSRPASPTVTPSTAPATPPSPPVATLAKPPSPQPLSPATSPSLPSPFPSIAPATASSAFAAPMVASPSCDTSIMSVLESDKQFSTLVALVKSVGLELALSDPSSSFTFFAPTNAAVMATLRRGSSIKFDIDLLRTILLNHLVLLKRDSSSFPSQLARLETLNGGNIFVKLGDGQLMIISDSGSATATHMDMMACNSVVHAVNGMLMPTSSSRRRV
ncbi:hypothetical protein N2152v2_009118 [Parachlorella kessleri]